MITLLFLQYERGEREGERVGKVEAAGSDADFIQATRTFCTFGEAPISREKLTPDLRGVTRIGFTYLLTRHRRCRYYAPSARYFTRLRSVTFSPRFLLVDRAYEILVLEPAAITAGV